MQHLPSPDAPAPRAAARAHRAPRAPRAHWAQRLLAAAGLLLGLGSAAIAAGPAKPVVPHREKPAFPQLQLPEREARGQRALDVLGSRLPEVAAFYGKSGDELKSLLLNDRSHRLDRRGRLFVVEELQQPLAATTPTASDRSLLDGTLLPLDQTFLLHSRSGAKRTIYLNFKGATLTGTAWNGSTSSLTALPFDLDGIPYSFNTAELQRIQAIWQRVAEDYAPFDVDVTTEAPTQDKLTRGGSTDDVFGTTVLITSSSGVYSCSCGGVAYLGVFDDTSDYYKPALVFYNQLGGGNEKYVAEAISHEAGHNMGLSHDGTASTGYYQGHGSGATGWAPIMGVGYYQALVQWSKGEYSGASNTQDDYAVMQSNGLPLRADDHGDTPATATVLSATASGGISSASASGVVERPSDIDYFSFAAGAGSATITVSPAARSPNLDAWVGLRDAAGTLLANVNPTDALNASVTVTLPAAGTYYLSVQGTGKGDPLGTGYSAYGSVGQYAVAASFPTPGSQAPVARISASALSGTAPLTVAFSGTGSTDADGSVVAWDWAFGDGGSASGAGASKTFSSAGTYSTVLRVTDNSGLSASTSVTAMRVADIAMGLSASRNSAKATAAVKVLDANGLAVAGATVSGAWSGLTSGKASATTDSTGTARFTSNSTRATSGRFTFTVKGVTRSGYSYAPSTNTETSDSIAR